MGFGVLGLVFWGGGEGGRGEKGKKERGWEETFFAGSVEMERFGEVVHFRGGGGRFVRWLFMDEDGEGKAESWAAVMMGESRVACLGLMCGWGLFS